MRVVCEVKFSLFYWRTWKGRVFLHTEMSNAWLYHHCLPPETQQSLYGLNDNTTNNTNDRDDDVVPCSGSSVGIWSSRRVWCCQHACCPARSAVTVRFAEVNRWPKWDDNKNSISISIRPLLRWTCWWRWWGRLTASSSRLRERKRSLWLEMMVRRESIWPWGRSPWGEPLATPRTNKQTQLYKVCERNPNAT